MPAATHYSWFSSLLFTPHLLLRTASYYTCLPAYFSYHYSSATLHTNSVHYCSFSIFIFISLFSDFSATYLHTTTGWFGSSTSPASFGFFYIHIKFPTFFSAHKHRSSYWISGHLLIYTCLHARTPHLPAVYTPLYFPLYLHWFTFLPLQDTVCTPFTGFFILHLPLSYTYIFYLRFCYVSLRTFYLPLSSDAVGSAIMPPYLLYLPAFFTSLNGLVLTLCLPASSLLFHLPARCCHRLGRYATASPVLR